MAPPLAVALHEEEGHRQEVPRLMLLYASAKLLGVHGLEQHMAVGELDNDVMGVER